MSIGKTVASTEPTAPVETFGTRLGILRAAALLLLPLSAAIGGAVVSITVGPIEVYPFKVLVPLLFVSTVLTTPWNFRFHGAATAVSAITLWTALGLLWSIDRGPTLQLLSVFVFVMLLFITLQMTGTDAGTSLALGWQIALVVTGAVALVELATGWHLPTEYIIRRPHLARSVTLSVFNNPNDYGAFLTVAIPLALFPIRGRTSRFAWALAGCSTIFLVTSNSRFAIIGLAAVTAVAVFRHRRGTWALPTAWSTVLAAVGVITVLAATGASIITKFASLSSPDAFISSPTGGSSSAGDRVSLILNGLWSAGRTGGMGTGGGTFELFRETWDLPFYVRPATINPHNMWVEVITELGIVGLVLLLVLIGVIYRPLTSRFRPLEPSATILWAALAGYVFAVATPSSYLKSPVSWMFLGTVYVLARSASPAGASDGTSPHLGTISPVEDRIGPGSIPLPRIEPLERSRGGRAPVDDRTSSTPIRPMITVPIGAHATRANRTAGTGGRRVVHTHGSPGTDSEPTR